LAEDGFLNLFYEPSLAAFLGQGFEIHFRELRDEGRLQSSISKKREGEK
jgi:hypothetical protein